MVVSCQKCRTRFQLDEARLPAKGVRVRCSKCKHAFFVVPPGEQGEAIHRLAEHAAATGRPAKARPRATVDVAPRSESEPEDDWQFNIEPAGGGLPGALPPPAEITDSEPTTSDSAASFFELDGLPDQSPERPSSERKPPIQPEQEVDFQNLGSPERWELSSPSPQKPSAAATTEEPPAPAKAAAPSRREAEVPAAPQRASRRRPPGSLLGELAGGAGWLAALALWLFGLQGALTPPSAVVAVSPVAVGALEIAELRVRHLDNLHAGPMVVVSGALRNSTGAAARADAAALVRILDAQDQSLELEPVWIGVEISDAELRQGDPVAMARAQALAARALAERTLERGERVAVTALLADLPVEAVGFRIESVPLGELPAAEPASPAETAAEPPPSAFEAEEALGAP